MCARGKQSSFIVLSMGTFKYPIKYIFGKLKNISQFNSHIHNATSKVKLQHLFFLNVLLRL